MMYLKKLLVTYSFIQVAVIGTMAQTSVPSKYSSELGQLKYQEVPLGSIKPEGWLLHQLQIMRNGTSGHLDEVYWKVKNDNGWLGGKGDGWEETPYWLDGAVPLAYQLDDVALKEKVLKYINWTLNNQRPSGYFGPITKWERETGKQITIETCEKGEDWWPRMIMLKVLKQYYTATNDNRVIPFMIKYFDYQKKVLKKCPIGKWTEWAQSRAHDNILMVQWLFSKTKDPSLLQLASLIQSQAFPWSSWLGNRDWVIHAAAFQNDSAWMSRHGVNVAMALKDPAVHFQRTGDSSYLKTLKTGFTDLMTLHGLPMGIFSADEDLHGNDPVQGTELCAVVEAQYSLEEIIGITGDTYYMEALERMTFNALPTQTTDDYNNKQYFQVANQVQVERGVYNFSLPFDREMNNVFGMRSGYTCCLANMHQGWTKFTSHLWYRTPVNGLAALHYSPNRITAKVGKNNTEVAIYEETAYPFDDQINFTFSTKNEVAFPMQLRIPVWCNEAIISLNGKEIRREKGGQIITIDRIWKNGDQLTLLLPMTVTTSNWGRNSRVIERGPLVYALKLEESWEKEQDEKEGEYFTVHPKGDWNYGILEKIVKDPIHNLEVKKIKPVSNDFVWNLANAPIEISAQAKKIPDWKVINDVAPQPVSDRTGIYKGKVIEEVKTITLVPYGCTKVRVVAFPVVK
ncbi:glycoside hydrolase family 127 protein [Chitinophagaceae bacterium LB-8]|uniref:Glycoside hydrolase family 127 protein n=1 Tax=Paraflavisolibacter caeni TaxID=2982496 RepID=A0A9X2XVW9_9BACT|nr:beta-L-arabinofuranosidase domain-containing protein [Paraflavisolibacter caeni]MCU7549601.1 glycoside hydrolase family 127 protein [Paraflavisolibacter caeni]